MSWLRRKHRHQWGPWSDPRDLNVYSRRYIVQTRHCEDGSCNLAEERFL